MFPRTMLRKLRETYKLEEIECDESPRADQLDAQNQNLIPVDEQNQEAKANQAEHV